MRLPMRLAVMAIAATAVLAMSTSAFAHQFASSNGATVRLHVDPDDEPVAGQPSTLWLVGVKVKKGAKFSYATCACKIKVATATGEVLLDQRVSKPRTPFVFPESAAYQITVSGKYRTKTKKLKSFTTNFVIRAS